MFLQSYPRRRSVCGEVRRRLDRVQEARALLVRARAHLNLSKPGRLLFLVKVHLVRRIID